MSMSKFLDALTLHRTPFCSIPTADQLLAPKLGPACCWFGMVDFQAEFRRNMSENFKVLYISDSLGTPIHPRGIFNFSLSFIEVLKSLGAHVTLLVEGAPGYGIRESDFSFAKSQSADLIGVVRVAELMRYFFDGKFISWINIEGKYGSEGFWGPIATSVMKILHGVRHSYAARISRRKFIKLKNGPDVVDYLPPKIAHMALMDGFLIGPKFYSTSMFAGANGFGVIPFDASGYDLVVVDTPHFIKLSGISKSRIISVVHDIIPLQDPTMSADWRALFIRKVEATLKNGGVMLFVSKTTRDAYYRLFQGRTSEPHVVISPPIRSNLLQYALATEHRAVRTSLSAMLNAGRARVGGIENQENAASLDGLASAEANLQLPFFVTPTSDEPRKNIGILMNAFRKLRGIANLVVVGDVRRKHYERPGDNANIFFVGYVSDEAKNELIGQSNGLIFPSLSEGFGIPVIEAGILKRPVICSKIKVFEEISGGHAIYFDPMNSNSIYDAVRYVLENSWDCEQRAGRLFDFVMANYSQDAMRTRVRKLLDDMLITASD